MIELKNINNKSEKTSSISTIYYSLENKLHQNATRDILYKEITKLKKNDNFPKNLTFIDAQLDESNGLCASAFLDDKTGKVIIGLTGTNNETSLLHATKDWVANANIALSVRNANNPYYKTTQAFIEKIDKKYDIDTFTGHSKGGHDSE